MFKVGLSEKTGSASDVDTAFSGQMDRAKGIVLVSLRRVFIAGTLAALLLSSAEKPALAMLDSCAESHFKKAAFPKNMPDIPADHCPASRNASDAEKLIHQNFLIEKNSLADFAESYKQLFLEQGWSPADEEIKLFSKGKNFISMWFSHPDGHEVFLIITDVMQKTAADPMNSQSFNLRLTLKRIS